MGRKKKEVSVESPLTTALNAIENLPKTPEVKVEIESNSEKLEDKIIPIDTEEYTPKKKTIFKYEFISNDGGVNKYKLRFGGAYVYLPEFEDDALKPSYKQQLCSDLSKYLKSNVELFVHRLIDELFDRTKKSQNNAPESVESLGTIKQL